MKPLSVLLIASALASGSACAGQQDTSHESAKAFKALDANGDGQLSTAELARHPMAAHASMVDADKNGTLDRREFEVLHKM